MTRHLARILVGLLLVAVSLGYCARWIPLPLVERLEAIAYDARLRLTMPGTLDPRIVIVDTDERSLQAEARWPWGRDKLARLADQLFDRYQVAVAGFDIVFAEPGDSSGLSQLEALAGGELKGNEPFEAALRELRRTARQLHLRVGDRRAGRPGGAATAREARSAGRHPRDGVVRPALDAGRAGLSRRGDPCQPDRRHAGRQHPATAALRAGRRVPAVAGHRPAPGATRTMPPMRSPRPSRCRPRRVRCNRSSRSAAGRR